LITGIALGVFFGLIIDNYLQTKPLMLILFFILGTLVGFYNMYKTLKKYKFF
jgi:F0F1-type ATP synthase assembly protein I